MVRKVFSEPKPFLWDHEPKAKPAVGSWALAGCRIAVLQLRVLKPPQNCTNLEHFVFPLSERNEDPKFESVCQSWNFGTWRTTEFSTKYPREGEEPASSGSWRALVEERTHLIPQLVSL